VEYLKLLGDQIVCAAGFPGEPQRGAAGMADFALGALDHCARLFSKLERPLEVQIGIDSGPVIGSAVGRERAIFNLWGEAVVTASGMAQTGVSGQIQATESTYRRLREDFLFHVRGSYYLEGFGEFATYTLTGRL
jgi:class 3 adenylate cyclase